MPTQLNSMETIVSKRVEQQAGTVGLGLVGAFREMSYAPSLRMRFMLSENA